MLLTLKLARIATVPVPLKFTQAFAMPAAIAAGVLVLAPALSASVVILAVPSVLLPSAPSTMLFEPELGFLRLVVESVLIGSLVKDVDRPGVERVGAVHGGDANAV